MAVKTITIDLEAYSRLKTHKRASESFSDVIKRVVKPPFNVAAWLERTSEVHFSDDAISAIEDHIAGRRRRSRRRA